MTAGDQFSKQSVDDSSTLCSLQFTQSMATQVPNPMSQAPFSSGNEIAVDRPPFIHSNPISSGPLPLRRKRAEHGPEARIAPLDENPITQALKSHNSQPGEPVFLPSVGMEFNSAKEAKDFYNLYSWEIGFGIRKGRNRINDNNYMTRQDLVCSCEVSSSKDDDKVSAFVAVAPPASSRFVCLKHSSSSLVIGSSSSEQHPAAGGSSGGGNSSYYANNHAAAASSSSPRTTREPAAAPSSHLPKARRPPSAFATSGIVPREPDEDDAEYFRQGMAAFGSLDIAAQLAEVKKFTGVGQQPQALAAGGGFSFWLTPQQVDDDLAYVYGKVNAQREAASQEAGNVSSSNTS